MPGTCSRPLTFQPRPERCVLRAYTHRAGWQPNSVYIFIRSALCLEDHINHSADRHGGITKSAGPITGSVVISDAAALSLPRFRMPPPTPALRTIIRCDRAHQPGLACRLHRCRLHCRAHGCIPIDLVTQGDVDQMPRLPQSARSAAAVPDAEVTAEPRPARAPKTTPSMVPDVWATASPDVAPVLAPTMTPAVTDPRKTRYEGFLGPGCFCVGMNCGRPSRLGIASLPAEVCWWGAGRSSLARGPSAFCFRPIPSRRSLRLASHALAISETDSLFSRILGVCLLPWNQGEGNCFPANGSAFA